MSYPEPVPCPRCGMPLNSLAESVLHDLQCPQSRDPSLTSLTEPTSLSEPTPSTTDPISTVKIEVECPSCHRSLKVRRQYLGRTVSCRHCNASFVVADPENESARAMLAQKVDRLSERIDEVESRLNQVQLGNELELARRDEQVHQDLAIAVDTARAAIEVRLSVLETRLGDLESSVRDQIQSGDRIEARLQNLEASETIPPTIEAEFHRLRDQIQQVNDQQARLLDRLVGIEEERDALRLELANRLSEQDQRNSEESLRTEQLQTRIEEFRSDLATLKSALAPVSVTAEPTPTTQTPSPEVKEAGLDPRAHDLILDRFFNADDRSEVEDPSTVPPTPTIKLDLREPTAPKIKPDPMVVADEYRRLGDEYAQAMNRRDSGEAIRIARGLIQFVSQHFGERSVEVSLWLRNLGLGLTIGGQQTEARTMLRQALELSEELGEAGRFGHTICLLDLTQSYLASGELRQANSLCEQALGAFKELQLPPNNPLLIRARESMARIRAGESGSSAFGSITIST